MTNQQCGLQLLSMSVLAAGCGHRALHPVAPSADAGFAPDLVDAGLASPDAARSLDGANDVGSTDLAELSSCNSHVSFHVEPDPSLDLTTLCPESCGGPLATLTSGTTQLRAGYWLSLDIPVVWVNTGRINGCVLACDTCQPVFCHSCIALTDFPASGFAPVWDGSYFLQGTCNGNACMGPTACAPAGHYVASFCVQRGVTIQGPYGPGGCLPLSRLDASSTQPMACGSVEFDLPSTASLSVKLLGATGARVPIDPGLASAVLDLVGSYRLTSSSGAFAGQTGSSKVQFTDVDTLVAEGIDSDLVIVTNPLPGDFPGSCTVPINVTVDGAGNWSLQNPATTCTTDGATVTLYPGYYTVSSSGRDLLIVAAGSSTGGLRSGTETFAFAYSGSAVRSP
jgi:hypothetical protein